MTNIIRRALLAIFIAVTASLGIGVGLASAHTPNQTVACSGWSVTLTQYEGGTNNNSITITIDGVPATSNFGGSFSASGSWDQYADHTFKYVIDANKVSGNATQYDKTYGPVTQTHCKNNPEKPTDGFTTRTVDGTCTVGQNSVDVKVYRTPFTWTIVDHVWVKSVGAEFLFSTTPRNLTAQEQITCKPTHEPKVVTVDVGEPKCGDTSVATQTTTTTYTYTYEEGQWVEHTTDAVTQGSRTVETTPCPTTPPTTVPPTTPPTTQPPVTEPSTTVAVTTPVPPTAPPASTIPPNVLLPATGSNNAGEKLAIAGMLVIVGAVVLRLRKPRNA